MSVRVFRARDLAIVLDRTHVMGVVNVTPDSFSDGGRFDTHDAAEAHALRLERDGAAILDLGGESTRPGHTPVSAKDEIQRVVPVIARLAGRSRAVLSIDTWKAPVADKALEAGAHVVNDVWGLRRDPEMARVAAAHDAGVVLMHNRLEADPAIDIVAEIVEVLSRSLDIALAAGIREEAIVLDPGIGFGKTTEQNPLILARLDSVTALGYPVLVGASRKRFIGHLTGRTDPQARLSGTLAAHVAAALGGAHIIRAHDVAAHADALAVADAISGKTA